MARTALKLAAEANDKIPPERTPARQKLATAIERLKTLEAEIAEASAELSKAEDRKRETGYAFADAEAELERAKPRLGMSHLQPRAPHTFCSQEEAEAYHALLNTPPPSIEDAKAAVASASDARDSALAAVQFHDRRSKQLTSSLTIARLNIDDALRLAVHYDPAMAALAAETKSLTTRAAAAARAFDIVVGTSLLQPDHVYYDSTKPTDFRTDPEGWKMVHAWRAALDALRTDPDAPLPMTS